MIVIDASVVVEMLTGGPIGATLRDRLEQESLLAPDFLPVEVASALRGLRVAQVIDDTGLDDALRVLSALRVDLHPTLPLLSRTFELRDNLTTYDACYVALAEVCQCAFLTFDARIARAAGPRCQIEVPRP